MEYGTIKIPAEEYERHNERRKDMGLTWADYIDGESPDTGVDSEEFEALREAVEQVPERTADRLAREVQSGGPR